MEFKKQLHLLVDMPKSGFGSTNDGNTAIAAFRSYQIMANILGVDERIVKKLHFVCHMLNSHNPLNHILFKGFCDELMALYIELYPWYPIPTSLHKILVHGHSIIDSFVIPIGQLSEEALESCHKYIKDCRRSHCRMFSRQNIMEDIMHWLLLTKEQFENYGRKKPTRL